ncbi:MAG: aminoacyl-tRNA hydrolase [Bdellovibrionota bacterium]|nr:MAG: aminoacyl-tRNA hydrolase [Bdellovibrionota bacterium]
MTTGVHIAVCAGLGNPGAQYAHTRHNVGFEFVDSLSPSSVWQERADIAVTDWMAGSSKIVLAKPLTYMNRSGEPLRELLHYRNILTSSLLVVHDDVDLPMGVLRIKFDGGTGGHNGLNSIVQTLGSDFYRIRLGVGRPTDASEMRNWVLGRWSPDEKVIKDAMLQRAREALHELLESGLTAAQNKFHRDSA